MGEEKDNDKIAEIIARFEKEYPEVTYELNWENSFQLLIATVLAAQCTDALVNSVTPILFEKFPDPKSLSEAETGDLENILEPIRFYRKKSRNIKEIARVLESSYFGEVPPLLEQLIELPGVARKTANVVLNIAFEIPSGIIVDSHVMRVSERLGLSKNQTAEKIETDLEAIVPLKNWIAFGAAMVLHGRYTCKSQKPKCTDCILHDLCPSYSAFTTKEESPMAKKLSSSKIKKTPTNSDSLFEDIVEETEIPENAKRLFEQIPDSWQPMLSGSLTDQTFHQLSSFLENERKTQTIYPPEKDVFNALKFTPFEKVRVLILGQDPYHGAGEAHGLAFSVLPGVRVPPSLRNMYQELQTDLGCKIPNHGYLEHWAKQGVMLLNAVLTVRAKEANSHKDRGWEAFTDRVISALSQRQEKLIFLLWGNYAQKKGKAIDSTRHKIIQSAHPSPLSAQNGFFGSKPYSKINTILSSWGQDPIDWQIPESF